MAITVVGCSKSERKFDLVKVTGKVYMGKEPLKHAAVTFTPRPGTVGIGGVGATDDEGKFTMSAKGDAQGIEPGEYVVTFTKWAQKDGSPIPEGKTAADVEAVQVVPAAYSNPNLESPPNVVTVKKEGGDFDFQIPAK
jgi:hypothetical protein